MFLYAINAIDRGRKASPRHIAPGHVIDLPVDSTVKNLIEIIAVREATDDEVKIARALGKLHENGEAVPESDAAQVEAETAAAIERKNLEDRANELGVKFSANISDAKLAERIAEAETSKTETTTLV